MIYFFKEWSRHWLLYLLYWDRPYWFSLIYHHAHCLCRRINYIEQCLHQVWLAHLSMRFHRRNQCQYQELIFRLLLFQAHNPKLQFFQFRGINVFVVQRIIFKKEYSILILICKIIDYAVIWIWHILYDILYHFIIRHFDELFKFICYCIVTSYATWLRQCSQATLNDLKKHNSKQYTGVPWD